MIERGSELNENIEGEDDVDQCVQDQEVHALHDNGIETELKRNTESVIQGQHNNEQFPLRFPGVILTYHKSLIFLEHLLEDFNESFAEGQDGIGIMVHFDRLVVPLFDGLGLLLEILPRFTIQFDFVVLIWLVFDDLTVRILEYFARCQLNNFKILHCLAIGSIYHPLAEHYEPLEVLVIFDFFVNKIYQFVRAMAVSFGLEELFILVVFIIVIVIIVVIIFIRAILLILVIILLVLLFFIVIAISKRLRATTPRRCISIIILFLAISFFTSILWILNPAGLAASWRGIIKGRRHGNQGRWIRGHAAHGVVPRLSVVEHDLELLHVLNAPSVVFISFGHFLWHVVWLEEGM